MTSNQFSAENIGACMFSKEGDILSSSLIDQLMYSSYEAQRKWYDPKTASLSTQEWMKKTYKHIDEYEKKYQKKLEN